MADKIVSTNEPKCVSFKYTTYCRDVNVNDNTAEGNISLQEAFRKYRESKQDELRQARMLKKRQELRKADPQKMAALRQKFVNQAKKYYGYPYARKYWPPDSPEYKSKLFLDCCGLVRKVMRDLAEDFGFIIGPWNQAYMIDTLPIKVESERDMKPGDLVFISATYYNPKAKKQRHNMTHVEIWAGEGNKTIGARWNNGKVQLFDHYKFVAKSYHSETYHFRSIDTWLKGICTSHCSQHSWRRNKYIPSKKSIFSLPEQGEQDEAAGDDNDEDVDNFTMHGNTFIDHVSDISKILQDCKMADSERPKTEMALKDVSSGTAIVKSTSAPVIKNNLGVKGNGVYSKTKKGKQHVVDRKDNTPGMYDYNEGAIAASMSEVENTDNTESDRHVGQLSFSGSLTDLGKKGFYLKDLVDAQKQENCCYDGGNAFFESGGESDDEYLSNDIQDYCDDNCFSSVDDEIKNDVEEQAVSHAKEDVSETNDDKGKLIVNIDNCEIESYLASKTREYDDSKIAVVSRKDERMVHEEAHKLIAVDNKSMNESDNNCTFTDECQGYCDKVTQNVSTHESKDKVEVLNEHKGGAEESTSESTTHDNIKYDGKKDKYESPCTGLPVADTTSKVLNEVGQQIIADTVFSNIEPLHQCCYGNYNQNAIPKMNDMMQSNKLVLDSDNVKASVVTMASQIAPAHHNLTQPGPTPVLPVESINSIYHPTSNETVQPSQSNVSCETDYRWRTSSLTGPNNFFSY